MGFISSGIKLNVSPELLKFICPARNPLIMGRLYFSCLSGSTELE